MLQLKLTKAPARAALLISAELQDLELQARIYTYISETSAISHDPVIRPHHSLPGDGWHLETSSSTDHFKDWSLQMSKSLFWTHLVMELTQRMTHGWTFGFDSGQRWIRTLEDERLAVNLLGRRLNMLMLCDWPSFSLSFPLELQNPDWLSLHLSITAAPLQQNCMAWPKPITNPGNTVKAKVGFD